MLVRNFESNFSAIPESCLVGMDEIEITSWKGRAFGIFTRVGEVSEIERVSAANE